MSSSPQYSPTTVETFPFCFLKYMETPFHLSPKPCCFNLIYNESASNNGGTKQQQSPTLTSVAQALEIARDSAEGAQDETVQIILERTLEEIWTRIQARALSYVMSREEFALFNYFQQRFEGQELTVQAIRRYWDSYRLPNGE
jgi:hypothetical protein